MELTARRTRVLQWIMPIVLLAWASYGRGLLGTGGWMTLIIIVYSPFILLALYALPIITLFDRDVKAARAVRHGYAVATWVMWGALFVFALALPDVGDTPGTIPSVLMRLGVPETASIVIAIVTLWAAVAAWLVAGFFAFRGAIASRGAS